MECRSASVPEAWTDRIKRQETDLRLKRFSISRDSTPASEHNATGWLYEYRPGEVVRCTFEVENVHFAKDDGGFKDPLVRELVIRSENGDVVRTVDFTTSDDCRWPAPPSRYWAKFAYQLNGFDVGRYSVSVRVTDAARSKTAEDARWIFIVIPKR